MNATASSGPARARGSRALSLLLAGALASGADACATLGEPAASVARDRALLRGVAVSSTVQPRFAVHSMTTGDGATVREYVSPHGVVFAMAWSGPALPDLKVLLGARYRHYAAALAASTGASKTLVVANDALVLRVVKLPRGLEGAAVAPALVPPGALAERIH